jgi:hypothetical protein
MILGLIAGTLSILITWIGLLAIAGGIGLMCRQAFGVKVIDSDGLLASFWMGMGFTIVFLQVWHFLLPIQWHALVVMCVVGMAGLYWSTDLRVWLARTSWRKHRALITTLALAGLWVANRAMGPGSAYDTGMYHLPAIDWTKSFPIVPGLGNLHGRLAFNSSSLLYAATLDVGPWSGRSHHIVNGLFLFALLIQIVFRIYQLPCSRESRRAHCIFDIAFLTPTLMPIQSSFFISSLTTDVPTAIVLFVATSMLFAQLVSAAKHRAENERAYNLVVLTTMLGVAVTLKLSAAVFSVVAWSLAVIWWLRHYQGSKILITKTLSWIVTISFTLGLSWLGRGVILSGYPVYPSRFGALPVEWRVPTEQTEAEEAWIGHYARYYYRGIAHHYLYGDRGEPEWTWLRPWIESLIDDQRAQWQITLPTLLAVLLLFSRLFLRRRRESAIESPSAGWLLLVPTLSGIAFWFVNAPRPVFGFFLFWILVVRFTNNCRVW